MEGVCGSSNVGGNSTMEEVEENINIDSDGY